MRSSIHWKFYLRKDVNYYSKRTEKGKKEDEFYVSRINNGLEDEELCVCACVVNTLDALSLWLSFSLSLFQKDIRILIYPLDPWKASPRRRKVLFLVRRHKDCLVSLWAIPILARFFFFLLIESSVLRSIMRFRPNIQNPISGNVLIFFMYFFAKNYILRSIGEIL